MNNYYKLVSDISTVDDGMIGHGLPWSYQSGNDEGRVKNNNKNKIKLRNKNLKKKNRSRLMITN